MHYLNMLFENQFAAPLVWVLGFAAIIGLALELKGRLRLGLSTAFFLSSLGLLNFLYWGTFVNFAAAQGAAYVLGLFSLFRHRDELVTEKVAVLSLLCLALFAACVSIGAIPFAWDEFFWSLFDKHISQFSSYWDTTSAILLSHIRYMPGSSLWHNFFGAPGYYSEGTSYFGNAMLLVAIIMFLCGLARRENRVFLGTALVLALGCFSEGLFNLYTDQFVGLFFGLCLITGTRFFEGEKDSLLPFALALASSLIFKETGLIPVIALLFTLVLVLMLRVKTLYPVRGLLLGLAYCVAAVAAWKFYMRHVGALEIIQLRLFTDFSPQMTDKYWAVLAEFSRRLVSSYDMLAVWILTVLIFREERGSPGARLKFTFFSLSLAGFLAVHLVTWLFLTVDNDGRTLAAFNRYMGSLLLGLFVYYAALVSSRRTLRLKHKALLCCLLAWVPLNLLWQGYMPSSLFRLVTPHPKQVPLMKKKMAALKARLPEGIYETCRKERPKIWFIYQDTNGLEAMMSRHLLAPCQVAYYNWSLGEKYYPGDVWTTNLDETSFFSMAREYPLMLTASIDDKFSKRYGRFFTVVPKNGMVYVFNPKLNKFVPH